eukprot:CAMPEP_0194272288 /NCGR_PEP_ID=MMETSP0169-20130528/5899_1 /TAXON_ID=218684 /ORGANISM="Corethron pennatum, Strain L29A3" /LENGTH=46 /DNA_ID= /DNA_START= /DNA_END= /DNA_ORIENTATION=
MKKVHSTPSDDETASSDYVHTGILPTITEYAAQDDSGDDDDDDESG